MQLQFYGHFGLQTYPLSAFICGGPGESPNTTEDRMALDVGVEVELKLCLIQIAPILVARFYREPLDSKSRRYLGSMAVILTLVVKRGCRKYNSLAQ